MKLLRSNRIKNIYIHRELNRVKKQFKKVWSLKKNCDFLRQLFPQPLFWFGFSPLPPSFIKPQPSWPPSLNHIRCLELGNQNLEHFQSLMHFDILVLHIKSICWVMFFGLIQISAPPSQCVLSQEAHVRMAQPVQTFLFSLQGNFLIRRAHRHEKQANLTWWLSLLWNTGMLLSEELWRNSELHSFTATFCSPEEHQGFCYWSMKVHKRGINTHLKNEMFNCQSQPFIIPELI